jgi:putative copper export protein/methionine-rich copper-binding protein CopC
MFGALLLVLEVIILGMLTAPRAEAHAELVSSDPPVGATLRSRSTALYLRFSEGVDVGHSSIVVVSGTTSYPVTALTTVGNDPTRLAATLPAAVPDGQVTVRWTSVSSDDGHEANGSYELHIATAAATTPVAAPNTSLGAPAQASPDTAGVSGLFTMARAASYLAMALLAGGLVFLALIWPEGAELSLSRRLLWAGWALGLAATVLGIACEGAYVSQQSLATLFDPSQLGQTLTTNFGIVWATRGLLYLLGIPVLLQLARDGKGAMRSLPWLVGAGAVTIAIIRTAGLASHPFEGPWAWLGSIADLVHVGCIATWIGGLVFLALVALRHGAPPELDGVVHRFSTLAMVAVGGALVAGTFLSWQLVGSLHGLTSTHYGRVLMIKLALVAAVLAVADQSRRWVARPRLQLVAGETSLLSVRPLVASVAIEIVLAVAVLGVASVLVNSSPVR